MDATEGNRGGWKPEWLKGPAGNLLFACCAVYLAQVFAAFSESTWIERVFGLSRAGLEQGWVWQFISYQFLHGSPLHLIANAMAIYFAGRAIAYVAGARFLYFLWLVAGFAGGAAELLGGAIDPQSYWQAWPILLGASSAGFAFLLAFTTLFPKLKITALFFFVMPVRLEARYLGWIAVGSTMVFQVFGLMPGIGHLAHLGGALVGWLAARWLRPRLPLILSGPRPVPSGGLSCKEG